METTTMGAGGISPPSESSTITRKIGALTGAQTPNIPEEIVIEILARLPVKSLLKFRCVSKSWRSIISNPSFAQFHLQASLNASSFTNHRLMLYNVHTTHRLHQLSSVRSLMEGEPSLIDDAVGIDFPGTRLMVLGSDNGLICISSKDEGVLLWNPTTKVHFLLPDVDVHSPPGIDRIDAVVGFGYTKSSEDYKVLIIFQMFVTGGVYDSFVMIYSHKSNSWKTMEPYNYKNMVPFPNAFSGKLVNGKLHFLMSPHSDELVWEIVYIDLDTETDGIIEPPDYGKGCFNPIASSLILGVLGGSLCVLYKGCDQQGIHNANLWVLKEYGVKESWTKLCAFQCIIEDWNPLFMLSTGEILFLCERGLAVYNHRYKTWNFPKIRNVGSLRDVFIHVENLVSPLPNAK